MIKKSNDIKALYIIKCVISDKDSHLAINAKY